MALMTATGSDGAREHESRFNEPEPLQGKPLARAGDRPQATGHS